MERVWINYIKLCLHKQILFIYNGRVELVKYEENSYDIRRLNVIVKIMEPRKLII